MQMCGCWFLSLVLRDIIWGELTVPLLFFSRVSRLIRDGAENLCVFPEWHLLRCARDCINSCSFSTGDRAPHIRLRRSSYKPDWEKMLGALTWGLAKLWFVHVTQLFIPPSVCLDSFVNKCVWPGRAERQEEGLAANPSSAAAAAAHLLSSSPFLAAMGAQTLTLHPLSPASSWPLCGSTQSGLAGEKRRKGPQHLCLSTPLMSFLRVQLEDQKLAKKQNPGLHWEIHQANSVSCIGMLLGAGAVFPSSSCHITSAGGSRPSPAWVWRDLHVGCPWVVYAGCSLGTYGETVKVDGLSMHCAHHSREGRKMEKRQHTILAGQKT